MSKALAGVDIGGTNTVIGLFDDSLTLVAKRTIPTVTSLPSRTDRPVQFLDQLAAEIVQLTKESGFKSGLQAVGMGVPGKVDPVRGIALGASNLGWFGVPFSREMSRRLGVAVRIDNDVRMYTLGEATAGAGKGCRNLICLTLGTGLAAGVIIDGRIVRGSDWYAGEIGHDTVQGVKYRCNCGKTGCLETVASATGIARLAKEAVESGANTSLRGLEKITSYDVYRACANGDRTAKEIFQYVGETLGHKLATIVYLLNPEMIIIGGGAAAAGEYLLDPIRNVIENHYTQPKKPIIRTGMLGEAAGLYGAVKFVLGQEHI